jgi:hypothetical protein
MFALFNKDKQFVGYGTNIPEGVNLYKKEISKDKEDFSKWRWVGDYDTGEMVSTEITPYPKNELDLQHELYQKIYKKYPIDFQNVLIIKQLTKLFEHLPENVIDNDFKEMSDLILKAVEIHEYNRKFYLNNNG